MPSFVILVSDTREGIRCLRCGFVSWNPNDVLFLYCGWCHRFHEEAA